jgi:hypothetical protein
MISSDQLLLVCLGHTPTADDRPPHVRGPLDFGRILGSSLRCTACQSPGAGCWQLDSVTSTFLQHLPGLSLPHAGQDNQYQRFSRAKIYPGQDAGDHAPPTLAPRRGRCIAPAELSARRQLDLVGLRLDWFPNISRNMGRPRAHGCQERTTFKSPPQGPD